MSYPYNYDIQFGTEHSFADDILISPAENSVSESSSNEEGQDDTTTDPTDP